MKKAKFVLGFEPGLLGQNAIPLPLVPLPFPNLATFFGRVKPLGHRADRKCVPIKSFLRFVHFVSSQESFFPEQFFSVSGAD